MKNDYGPIDLDLSRIYHNTYGVNDDDIEKANNLRAAIERSRRKSPTAGDAVHINGPKASYPNGRLLLDDPTICAAMCVMPYVPFVFMNGTVPVYEASGGYWCSAKNDEKLEHMGTKLVTFKAWGRGGPQANGAFYFWATVNNWSFYSEGIY